MRECELSLTRQAPVLHHMHHLNAQTLQQLIYACIGTQAYSTARNTSAVFRIVWLSRGGHFGYCMVIMIVGLKGSSIFKTVHRYSLINIYVDGLWHVLGAIFRGWRLAQGDRGEPKTDWVSAVSSETNIPLALF